MTSSAKQNPVTHLGDGLYAEFDGWGVSLRVNDHRNAVVAYIDGLPAMEALQRFWKDSRKARRGES